MNSDDIRRIIETSAATTASLVSQTDCIARMGQALVDCFRNGGKVLTAGNGGSAAEALHLAEECVGRFQSSRVALPAVALVADPTAMTCIGNDFGFDHIFSRPVEALGKAGDVLVLFSTSGKAANLSLALEAARQRDMIVISILGRDGGPLANRADLELVVQSQDTARIQETHQVVVHLLLQAVEDEWTAV